MYRCNHPVLTCDSTLLVVAAQARLQISLLSMTGNVDLKYKCVLAPAHVSHVMACGAETNT